LRQVAEALAHLQRLVEHVVTRHLRASAGRRQEAGEHLHGGRLPGAVRPEKAQHLAAADGETHPVDRPGRAVVLGQSVDLNHHVRHGHLIVNRAWLRFWFPGSRPAGLNPGRPPEYSRTPLPYDGPRGPVKRPCSFSFWSSCQKTLTSGRARPSVGPGGGEMQGSRTGIALALAAALGCGALTAGCGNGSDG